MTYGWAILIIVIVAVILYSMGIFNPSSSISATVTGFASSPVSSAICTSNGVLRFAVGDTTGHRIEIKNITATISGKTVTFTPNATVDPNPTITPGSTYIFSVPNVCPSVGTHFSAAATIDYTEPSTPFPSAIYPSSGTITGTVSSTTIPAFALSVNNLVHSLWYGAPASGVLPFSWVPEGGLSYMSANQSINGTNSTYTIIMWVKSKTPYPTLADYSMPNGLYVNTYAPNSSYTIVDAIGLFGFEGYTTLGTGKNGNSIFLHRCSYADTQINMSTAPF
ncbi:MAG: hypothetical protein BJBARM4_1004, partial [Candidatus Parvarchaeum acidiphilum ARMAN-4]